MSKQLIDWEWYTDGNRIYSNLSTELKHADARTFEALNHVWARDKTHVFQGKRLLQNADRNTFVVLNDLYAKDAGSVYFAFGRISDADAKTFMAFPEDDWYGLRSYAKDKDSVFHYVFTIGKPVKLRTADAGTFRAIGRGYGVDAHSVFYETRKLAKADPATLKLLPGGQYSKDHKSVYFRSELVSAADPNSFEVLPCVHYGGTGRDNQGYYHENVRIERADYFAGLQTAFIFIGTVSKAVVTDRNGNELDNLQVSDETREQGIAFEIDCERLLFAPNVPFENPPLAGAKCQMIQRSRSCNISAWIGKRWIWFFYPLARPNTRILVPIREWRDFSSMEDLGRIESLVNELREIGTT